MITIVHMSLRLRCTKIKGMLFSTNISQSFLIDVVVTSTNENYFVVTVIKPYKLKEFSSKFDLFTRHTCHSDYDIFCVETFPS